MAYQNPQNFMISLKLLMKNKNNEYLLLKSPNDMPGWFGKYDLVGGRINDNEINIDFHKLIDREVKEEIGKKIKYKLRKDPVALGKYQFKDGRCILYILFEAKYLSGKIKISNEHVDYIWTKLNSKNAHKYFHKKFTKLFKTYLDWNKNVKVNF